LSESNGKKTGALWSSSSGDEEGMQRRDEKELLSRCDIGGNRKKKYL
jgi:hypothetical protein